MVPEIQMGRFSPLSFMMLFRANMAALAFKVSKMVSNTNISTPPSRRPLICSEYTSFIPSKVILR
jgi:hypothetical protein